MKVSLTTNIAGAIDLAQDLDSKDPLAGLREHFALPPGVIYLDGNSLGVLPKNVAPRMQAAIAHEWGTRLIRSWNEAGWIDLPGRVGGKIAGLIGADADEVIAADSTSINIFKMLASALFLRPERKVIVSERGNFPTDLYVAEGLNALLGRGHQLRLADNDDELMTMIGRDTACVMLTEVDFRTGRWLDMKAVTAHAHAQGALTLWDLSHSAGAVPVDLHGANADLAVGCGYKYLNGGPGAPAFLYVRRDLQPSIRPPLSGWMGHAAPFAFTTDYTPAEGMMRNLCGTPPVLALTALDAALDVWSGIDMQAVRAKSLSLSRFFLALVEEYCTGYGLNLISPRDEVRRGSQLAFSHDQGFAVMQCLISRGVIGDFRAPNLLRFGFTPLYLSHRNMVDAVAILRDILSSSAWDRPEFKMPAKVT